MEYELCRKSEIEKLDLTKFPLSKGKIELDDPAYNESEYIYFKGDGNSAIVNFDFREDLPVGSVYIQILEVENKGLGFGSKVLKEILQFFKTQNCSDIYLHPKNENAKRFYLKNGYKVFFKKDDYELLRIEIN